jgi:threonine synthase
VRYVSTRGAAPVSLFEHVLLTGLAEDGGLYVPEEWPVFSLETLRSWRGLAYPELVAEVIFPFLNDTFDISTLRALAYESYRNFEHSATAPLRQINQQLWLLELFHGPTLSFKDYALQLLGRLFNSILAQRGEKMTVIGATSGDTGSAAIEAYRDCTGISEVQRRQMTTVFSSNVHVIAIDGSFDDCQDLVKAMFNDYNFRKALHLSAVNSINWARIMIQIVYYIAAALAIGAPDRAVAFSVPTGNFGNIYAAYSAAKMGLPIRQLIIGSNSNDILDRFFRSGEMCCKLVTPTLSPSMDIQISSNFERLLFELYGKDGAAVDVTMRDFRTTGRFTVTADQLAHACTLFSSYRFDDNGIRNEIAQTWKETGQVIDPHTAVGLSAARAYCNEKQGAVTDLPLISLACAHPAKFPGAVAQAVGFHPALPPRLVDLLSRAEQMTALPNELAAVQAFIRERTRVIV